MRSILAAGIILLVAGTGNLPPAFSWHWWLIVIGAVAISLIVPIRGEKR